MRRWWFGTFIGASIRFVGLRNQGCPFVIMKNYIEQRTVDPQMVADVVVDKPQLPESIHEKAHA